MLCSRCHNECDNNKYKTCTKCREYNKKYRDNIPRTYKQGEYSTKDNLTKVCCTCNNSKNLTEFYKHKRYKDGYRNQCINCHRQNWKTYYDENYKKVLIDKQKNDPIYRLKQNQKSYIHIQLKNVNRTKNKNTVKYLGCSINIFILWLSFLDKNWENCQLDHVIPVSLFDLTNPNEIKLAFHWTNIQPLVKKENLEKYNKIYLHQYFNNLVSLFRFKHYSKEDISVVKELLKWLRTKYNRDTFKLRETP